MSRKGKRSRRGRRASPPAPGGGAGSERPLLDRIASGALDPHLTALAEAIRGRFDLLEAINSQKTFAALTVGERVRINHRATVCVHRPVGRFKSGEVRCPPLVLDRLPRAA